VAAGAIARARHGLWQHRDFLLSWSAQDISAVGSRITRTALPTAREAIDAVAEISGPALGSALVAWLTAPLAIAVDAASFVVSAALTTKRRSGSDSCRREPWTARRPRGKSRPGC
jgi:hypothetical protein